MLLKRDLTKTGNVSLTMDGYFPNRNQECGITALANLIYSKFEDFGTAKEIYFNSKNHPLVGYDGTTSPDSFPELLEDLSNNRYSGNLHVGTDFDVNVGHEILDGRSLEKLRKSFNNSLEKGLIKFGNNFSGNTPLMLFLENLPASSGHALVHLGERYIDNGNITYVLDKNFAIVGVFDAFKK